RQVGLQQGGIPGLTRDGRQSADQRPGGGPVIGQHVVLGNQPREGRGGSAREQAQRLHDLHRGAIRSSGPLLALTTSQSVSPNRLAVRPRPPFLHQVCPI